MSREFVCNLKRVKQHLVVYITNDSTKHFRSTFNHPLQFETCKAFTLCNLMRVKHFVVYITNDSTKHFRSTFNQLFSASVKQGDAVYRSKLHYCKTAVTISISV